MDKFIITPKTKVGELLEKFPELEDALIEIAPTFKKLKNPVLRKTIAKITSLEQAAAVAGIGVEKIVNKMRQLAGQDDMDIHVAPANSPTGKPDWLDESKVVKTHNALDEISRGEHPLGAVMGWINHAESGQIYLLISPFYPAPLLDKAGELGCSIWSDKKSDELYNNYILKV